MGVDTLLITTIINSVIPMIERAAFQVGMSGSYSPNDYHIYILLIL